MGTAVMFITMKCHTCVFFHPFRDVLLKPPIGLGFRCIHIPWHLHQRCELFRIDPHIFVDEEIPSLAWVLLAKIYDAQLFQTTPDASIRGRRLMTISSKISTCSSMLLLLTVIGAVIGHLDEFMSGMLWGFSRIASISS